MFSESIFGTLFITSIILSPATLASEKYFTFDKPAPNALSHKEKYLVNKTIKT
jgi:hypothetical protein